ncbi:hypothetical protein V1281_004255 [Nitrobacteraceae bacterium AZCC 2161]
MTTRIGQRLTATVPRMVATILNQTVVDRTILFLTPLLKSAASHSPAFSPFENNPERGRARLRKFGSTAGRVLSPRSSLRIRSALDWARANRPGSPVRVEPRVKSSRGSAGSFSTGLRIGIADRFDLLREHRRVVSKSMRRSAHSADQLCRLSRSLDRARWHPTRCFERQRYSLRNPKDTPLACYSLSARRHAPGLTPTMRWKCRAR